MHIDLKTVLTSGLLAGLAASMSVVYAEDEFVPEPSVDGAETIVISLGSNPRKNPEPACVALQIGMNLLMSDLNGPGNPGGDVTPADSVTLFATLDGVELVAPDSEFTKNKFMCLTPNGDAPLSGLLTKFMGMPGANLVVCPLCWEERGYDPIADDPTFGNVGSGLDIHELFLYADKVLTF